MDCTYHILVRLQLFDEVAVQPEFGVVHVLEDATSLGFLHLRLQLLPVPRAGKQRDTRMTLSQERHDHACTKHDKTTKREQKKKKKENTLFYLQIL